MGRRLSRPPGIVRLGQFFFAQESELARHLWLVCLLDFLRIPLWVQGFVNPHVVWRGKKYRVMPDATVRPES